MKKIISMLLAAALVFGLTVGLTGCTYDTSGFKQDVVNTMNAANTLQSNQPTPTDIYYSLERYNLIRRAYWVNGQREKANTLPCEIEKPLGYIVLFSSNAVVGSFVVDGKVSSLNSFLTPDSEYYEMNGGSSTDSNGPSSYKNKWLATWMAPTVRMTAVFSSLHRMESTLSGLVTTCTLTFRLRLPTRLLCMR